MVILTVSCASFNNAAKYPDMVADVDPFSIGTVNASFDQTFPPQLRTDTVEVIFYPRENKVALEFKMNLGQYRQFWDKEGRRLFAVGLSRYEEDFDKHRLTNNYNKTSSVYGKFKSRFEWKATSLSSTYKSSPVVQLGYRFRGDSPFFATRQLKADEETKTNEGLTESPSFSIYFNRAQAKELAGMFDEAFLKESVQSKGPTPALNTIGDEYQP